MLIVVCVCAYAAGWQGSSPANGESQQLKSHDDGFFFSFFKHTLACRRVSACRRFHWCFFFYLLYYVCAFSLSLLGSSSIGLLSAPTKRVAGPIEKGKSVSGRTTLSQGSSLCPHSVVVVIFIPPIVCRPSTEATSLQDDGGG